MFRGKESLNRIELSRLVQDLLNFAVLGSLRLWGGGRWVGGVRGIWGHGGVSPRTCTCTCTRTHTHAHTHMYTCIDMEASMFSMVSMFNMHVHAYVSACAYVCMCVCMGHPPHTHTRPHPMHPAATPPGESPESVKIR